MSNTYYGILQKKQGQRYASPQQSIANNQVTRYGMFKLPKKYINHERHDFLRKEVPIPGEYMNKELPQIPIPGEYMNKELPQIPVTNLNANPFYGNIMEPPVKLDPYANPIFGNILQPEKPNLTINPITGDILTIENVKTIRDDLLEKIEILGDVIDLDKPITVSELAEIADLNEEDLIETPDPYGGLIDDFFKGVEEEGAEEEEVEEEEEEGRAYKTKIPPPEPKIDNIDDELKMWKQAAKDGSSGAAEVVESLLLKKKLYAQGKNTGLSYKILKSLLKKYGEPIFIAQDARSRYYELFDAIESHLSDNEYEKAKKNGFIDLNARALNRMNSTLFYFEKKKI